MTDYIRLRQICLVARRLEPLIGDLSDILGLTECYRDGNVGKYGLENALLPVDTILLEVVAPTQDGTAAGRFLDKTGERGGYLHATVLANRAAAEQDDGQPARARKLYGDALPIYKRVLGARHSETLEVMVLYQALYGAQGLWVRPRSMFLETVQHGAATVPRFARLAGEPDAHTG